MRRWLLVLALATLGASGQMIHAPMLSAQTSVPVQVGAWSLSTVAEWRAGPCGAQPGWPGDTCNGLLLSNNADGELRLDAGATSAVYTSVVSNTAFLYNAVGATWQADIPAGTSLKLEIRGGTSAKEEDMTPWQPLTSGDAQSQDDGSPALEQVLWPPARAAVALLAAPDLDCVKECANHTSCGWLFLDRSKNGSRSWCG
ncbi:hypothetical protein SE17_22505, partial [Kouleothrix aurantiaca]